jgi:predicted transcriptional regulator
MSPNDLYKILKKNKIILRGNKIDNRLEVKICNLYKSGLSIEKISKKLILSESCVQKYLKKNNVKTRKEAGRFKRTYRLDETILSEIDSFEKAQFLGLIYSDGSISSHNNLISIRLREDDVEYLNNWRKNLLKTNKPIYISNSTKKMISPLNNKKYKIKHGTAILDITSKRIYDDAINIGLCPNKTKANLHMPKINNKYKIGFLLGLFEGDGSISMSFSKSTYAFTIACQSNMANDISKYLNKLSIKCQNYSRGSINIIQISKIENIIKIYYLLYGAKSKVIMSRKYKKFTKLIKKLNKTPIAKICEAH